MPLLETLRFVDTDRLAAELLTADVALNHRRHLGLVEAATAAHCANASAIVLVTHVIVIASSASSNKHVI